MASTLESFQDLNLSRDEVERIGEALKNKEFRKLLTDYVDEIQDPENRKLYEKEVTELEKERGMDVKFINPSPGYVIKTSANGTKKAFINVASNEHIGRPNSTPTYEEGHRGLQWSLPHTLSPPRDDYDSKRIRCVVYDVVFHPDTLRLAKNNKQFKNLVNSTACESIEKSFGVKLDEKNLKFPNLHFKGCDHPSIIRTPCNKDLPQTPKSEEEQKFYDDLFSRLPPLNPTPTEVSQPSPKSSASAADDVPRSKYTTPKYVIKHRTLVDMQEYTYNRDAKENVAIPKELVVEVHLPMLRSSEGVTLDVTEKTIQLTSETSAKYKLHITLPYAVNQELGNAKFEKDCRKLVITLPVIRNKHFLITDVNSVDDSGVESDHGSPTLIEELDSKRPEIRENLTSIEEFFDSSIEYTLPEHLCRLDSNNVLNFTFKAKNTNGSSIEKRFLAGFTTLLVKFTSISTGFFPVHYGIIIQLSDGRFDEDDEVKIDAWDNNVTAQMSVVQTDALTQSYFYGSKQGELVELFLENEPQKTCTSTADIKHIIMNKNKKTDRCENSSLGTGFSSEVKVVSNLTKLINTKEMSCDGYLELVGNSECINKNRKSCGGGNAINTNSSSDEEANNNNKKGPPANVSENASTLLRMQEQQPTASIKKFETVQSNHVNNNNMNLVTGSHSAQFDMLKSTQAVNISHGVRGGKCTSSSSHGSTSSQSSSCDEQSNSYGYSSCSPVKNMTRGKGILKQRMRGATRSISESGLDDAVCCLEDVLDMENCCHSVGEEGDIQEEEEPALAASVGSSKKTVRFNENISQQLFRSNSSILGQKKKNQRKARNKKRAHERRHSESEISDGPGGAGNAADSNGTAPRIKTELENGKDTQFDLDI